MASIPALTLYDLDNKKHTPYSPYTWQVRLILNYKNLPFKTVWLNLVDIKPTMEKLGTTPAEPNGKYTVPVLIDGGVLGPPIVLSDSGVIAEYLDKKYPENPIFPEGTKALLSLYEKYLKETVFSSIRPISLTTSLSVLNECDHGYFRESRECQLGIKLEELCPTEEARREHILKLRAALDAVAQLLDRNGEGCELVIANTVSRGDFILIAFFAYVYVLDFDLWKEVMTWSGGKWERLWSLSEDWRRNKV